MSTDALLLLGAATAVIFVVVLTVEGARRPGYVATYHTGSELELGPGGWIQRTNFLLVGAGFAAIAVGIQRVLGTQTGSALVGIAALGLVLAGIFAPDPPRIGATALRGVGDLHARDRGSRARHDRLADRRLPARRREHRPRPACLPRHSLT